jgi:hypothetical protein
MKGRFVTACFALVALVAFSTGASANTIRLAHDTSQYSYSNGGEFQVTEFVGGTVPSMAPQVYLAGYFQTFCIEKNEYFSPGAQYVWSVSSEAKFGGVSRDDPYAADRAPGENYGDTGSGDALSPETAYLYTQFWDGVLSNYDYTVDTSGGHRTESAGALQMAIWYLEGEVSYHAMSTSIGGNGQALAWVNEAHTAVTTGAWVGLGYVRVLNIYDKSGNPEQDQLVMMPLPAASLAGLALLMGLAGARKVRRRRRA